MKNLFILLLICSTLSCNNNSNSSTSPAVVATPANLTGYTVTEIPGSNMQKASKFAADGQLIEEGFLLNGNKTGAWVIYHSPTGRVKSITSYVDGNMSGIFVDINDRGLITKQASYGNNVLNGRYFEYKASGTSHITRDANLVDNAYDGIYRNYFENTSKVREEIGFKAGKKHGAYKLFDTDGKQTLEYTYDMGEKVSGGVVK